MNALGVVLLPCPFCGGPGRIMSKTSVGGSYLHPEEKHPITWHFIGCHDASCEIKPKVTRRMEDSALGVKLWNIRAGRPLMEPRDWDVDLPGGSQHP